ncbi:MAG: EpsG family protein [Marinifilaceae bacterium]|jgi:hypothetical protein|nr:EpsG family protein [Marinifilaceae bacterium]
MYIILLIIPLGIRSIDVGTDTITYFNIFEDIRISGSSYIEPMWLLINKFVLFFNGDFTSLMLLVSFLTIYPLGLYLRKESENPNLSLFLYYSLCFYGMAFNISRQILATSFIFIAYYYLSKNKRIKYTLMVIFASLFHLSSIFALFVYLFNKIKLTTKKIYLLLVFSMFFGTFLINDKVIRIIAGKYANYILTSEGYRTSLIIPIVLTLILNCLFIFLYLTSENKIKVTLWFKVYFLSVIVNNMSYTLILGSRLLIFFSISQIIYFVSFIYNNRIKQKYISFSVILLYSLVLFLRMILTNGGEIVPYNLVCLW